MRTPHGTPIGETEESHRIMGIEYDIVAQNEFEYAVRVTWKGYEPTWIREPRSRFETIAAARYAILSALALESQLYDNQK